MYIYIYIYITNCRQYCFGLLGLISAYIYIYKQIQVIHRWIQKSAQQLRSGLLLYIYIYITSQKFRFRE